LAVKISEYLVWHNNVILAPKDWLSVHTDMTIHWKALEEHFLMVPLVFRFNHFRGENAFSELFSKNLSPLVNAARRIAVF
jgi:hypothetical protein